VWTEARPTLPHAERRDRVDLLKPADAGHHRHVPDLFETYCRPHAAVSLPSLIGSLSVLVATEVLTARE